MEIKGLGGKYANQSITVNETVTFGRNAGACNVLFPDETKGISRMHCKIEKTGEQYTITDLGSSYGTFLNGAKITPYAAMPLKNGDTFYLGDKRNIFSVNGTSSKATEGTKKMPHINVKIIGGIAAIAVVLILVIAFNVYKNREPGLEGSTWEIVSMPGSRISFSDKGEVLYSYNGKYEQNGEWTYSSVGDHLVNLRYIGADPSSVINASLFNALMGYNGSEVGESLYNAYSNGQVLEYKYDKSSKSYVFYDMNGRNVLMITQDTSNIAH